MEQFKDLFSWSCVTFSSVVFRYAILSICMYVSSYDSIQKWLIHFIQITFSKDQDLNFLFAMNMVSSLLLLQKVSQAASQTRLKHLLFQMGSKHNQNICTRPRQHSVPSSSRQSHTICIFQHLVHQIFSVCSQRLSEPQKAGCSSSHLQSCISVTRSLSVFSPASLGGSKRYQAFASAVWNGRRTVQKTSMMTWWTQRNDCNTKGAL